MNNTKHKLRKVQKKLDIAWSPSNTFC